MPKPPVPLRLAHAFDCGPIRVELAYTPVTVPDHVSGRTDEDPFRDRFEIRRGSPASSSCAWGATSTGSSRSRCR